MREEGAVLPSTINTYLQGESEQESGSGRRAPARSMQATALFSHSLVQEVVFEAFAWRERVLCLQLLGGLLRHLQAGFSRGPARSRVSR